MSTRRELFSRLGLIRVVDPLVERAYESEIERQARSQRLATSFHASRFPIDGDIACGRQAIYKLMNIPRERFEPAGMAIMNAGVDIEQRIVAALANDGKLLHSPENQVKLELPDYWLAGYVDAVVEHAGRPHPIEIKGKDLAKITEMRSGQRSWGSAHRGQLMCYVGIGHETSSEIWPDLAPMDSGTLYYVARDRPRETQEYYFEHDPRAFLLGLERLRSWKEAWLDGVLPERNESFRWTKEPCRWCDYKPICKQDIRNEVGSIDDSAGTSSEELDRSRRAIYNRWGDG